MEKIAFITGSGAVENAWVPILTALKGDAEYNIDSDGANCFFARLVYLMRFYATGTFPDAKEHAQICLKMVKDIKAKISCSLLLAEEKKQIRARKELDTILNKFIFSEVHESFFITTNWDTVIDTAIEEHIKSNFPFYTSNIQFLHLHGCITHPQSLYLPSEVIREAYRSSEEDIEMGALHGAAWSTIEQCNKTILYGLSLDPLDAELSHTLSVGWSSPNLKEIIIINPDHKKVSQRIKLLLDSRYPAKIIGYSSFHLNEKFEY